MRGEGIFPSLHFSIHLFLLSLHPHFLSLSLSFSLSLSVTFISSLPHFLLFHVSGYRQTWTKHWLQWFKRERKKKKYQKKYFKKLQVVVSWWWDLLSFVFSLSLSISLPSFSPISFPFFFIFWIHFTNEWKREGIERNRRRKYVIKKVRYSNNTIDSIVRVSIIYKRVRKE